MADTKTLENFSAEELLRELRARKDDQKRGMIKRVKFFIN
jgi:hypothetical protein